MTTVQIILLIIVGFCFGVIVGLIISNFNHNRLLIKHGISPRKFESAVELDLIPTDIEDKYNIKDEETKTK